MRWIQLWRDALSHHQRYPRRTCTIPINKGETFYQEIRQMAPRIDLASDKFVPFVEKHLQERVKNPSHLCGKPKPLWANFSQTVRFLGLKTEWIWSVTTTTHLLSFNWFLKHSHEMSATNLWCLRKWPRFATWKLYARWCSPQN